MPSAAGWNDGARSGALDDGTVEPIAGFDPFESPPAR